MTEKQPYIENGKNNLGDCDLFLDTKNIKFNSTKSLYELKTCSESDKLKEYIEKEKDFLNAIFSKPEFEHLVGTNFIFNIHFGDDYFISVGNGKKSIVTKESFDILEKMETFVSREFLLFQTMRYDLQKGFIPNDENFEKIQIHINTDSNNKNFVKDVEIIKKGE